jgi:hypothetical protein
MGDDDFDEVVDDQPLEGSADDFQDDADENDDSGEEFEKRIIKGDKEADTASEEGREKLEEDDEITPAEAGFAKGASGGKRHK